MLVRFNHESKEKTFFAIISDRTHNLSIMKILSRNIDLKKVKVSHSLIAVGAVGVRVPLCLGHS